MRFKVAEGSGILFYPATESTPTQNQKASTNICGKDIKTSPTKIHLNSMENSRSIYLWL